MTGHKILIVLVTFLIGLSTAVRGEESQRFRGQSLDQEDPSAGDQVRMSTGTRVRIKVSNKSESFVGNVLEIDDVRVTMLTETDSQIDIPRNSIAKLEVHNGKKRHTWLGLLIGAGAGAVLGAIEGPTCVGDECYTRAGNAVVSALGGGLVGMLVGALVTTDRWIAIPTEHFHVQVNGRRGGAAVVLNLSF
jgi:hypothetical protein